MMSLIYSLKSWAFSLISDAKEIGEKLMFCAFGALKAGFSL